MGTEPHAEIHSYIASGVVSTETRDFVLLVSSLGLDGLDRQRRAVDLLLEGVQLQAEIRHLVLLTRKGSHGERQ